MFRKSLFLFILLFAFSINAEISQVGSANSFTGLSTDTKPTTVEAGSVFYETNTNNLYRYDGDSWNPKNSRRFIDDVRQGLVSGFRVLRIFGQSHNISTSYLPVTSSETYATPLSAVSLEFVSDNTADALDDIGMREITITGLDASFNEQTAIVASHATDGLTAVSIPNTWIRILGAEVTSSGSYATQSAGSHVGEITIRISGGGAIYAVIIASETPHGISQIGVYTIPAGFTAYIGNIYFGAESNKSISVIGITRSNANDVTSPYSGIRKSFVKLGGISSPTNLWQNTWRGPFNEYTDIGFMALVKTGTASVSVDFEILLIKNQ